MSVMQSIAVDWMGYGMTPERVRQLLAKCDPDCSQDDWWKIGCSVRAALGAVDGFDLFDAWSRLSRRGKYPGLSEMRWKWNYWERYIEGGRGADPNKRPIGAGTLVHYATEHDFGGIDPQVLKEMLPPPKPGPIVSALRSPPVRPPAAEQPKPIPEVKRPKEPEVDLS